MRPARTALRSVAVPLASLLGFLCVTGAAPRVPQIPVAGTGLRDLFAAWGEAIDVQNSQLDVERVPITALAPCSRPGAPMTVMFDLWGNGNHNSYGLYQADATVPTLLQVFPPEAGDGWFAVASFRVSPYRLVVNLFDQDAIFMGVTTYPGVDQGEVGLYVQTPAGPLFSEDARNPGGEAQALTFEGMGMNAVDWWICWEDQPLQASDHDFDDCLLRVDRDCETPVSRTS